MLAHAISPGLGGFHNGLLHPVASLDQLLALVALGLLGGFCSPRSGRLAVAGASLGAAIGVMLAAAIPGVREMDAMAWMISVMLGAGCALAGAWTAPAPLPGLVALPVGMLSVMASSPTGFLEATDWATLSGAAVGAPLLVLLSAGLARRLAAGKRIQTIALRVLGSWIGAVAVMLAAM